MKNLRFVLLGAALAGVFAAAAAAQSPPAAAPPTTVTVKMVAQNASGETGSAVLTQVSGGTQVVITLDGSPKDTPQPAHIHEGNCGKINPAPKYPLTNVVNGKSSSVVKGVTLADLLKGPYAINVHKSGTEIATYVSCGNITATSSSGT
ncbi:MAG TPA: hypothetical protein VF741_02530 [Candidatus Aquilonibacter sp.]